MTDRKKRTQLQPVEPTEPDPVLAKITDPVAREIYRKKVELGMERDPFMDRCLEHTSDPEDDS